MAVHILELNEENFKICLTHGLAGIPEPKETVRGNNIFDALLSRMACVKEDDYILNVYN